MAESDACFTLTIHTRSADFGERPDQENNLIRHILQTASQRIGTGHGPIPLKDRSGNDVAEYRFGPGMLNFDKGSA